MSQDNGLPSIKTAIAMMGFGFIGLAVEVYAGIKWLRGRTAS